MTEPHSCDFWLGKCSCGKSRRPLTEAEKVAKIERFSFDRIPDLTDEQEKHRGHFVVAVAPYVWFCQVCVEQFDGELDPRPEGYEDAAPEPSSTPEGVS